MKLQFMLRIQMESCKYLFFLSFKRSDLEQAHRKMIDGVLVVLWPIFWKCLNREPVNLSSHIPAPHTSQLQRCLPADLALSHFPHQEMCQGFSKSTGSSKQGTWQKLPQIFKWPGILSTAKKINVLSNSVTH